MIAISTAWIPEDGWTIERVLDRMDQLDPQAVELNYRVHPLDLERTQRALAQHGLAVPSLHNICSNDRTPVPHTDRYGDSIADLNEAARRAAVRSLTATAETARALGARAIVVHSGAVDSLKESRAYHQAMKQASRADIPEIVRRELPAWIEERQRIAPQHLGQLVKSLNEVCPQFPDIQFGLETRYHFHGFPNFDELELVLAQMDGNNLGYWHDCGHGQVQENLGIRRHEDWLCRYQDRLIGVHLHGMFNRLLDHEAPAPGNMDFSMVSRYTKRDTLLTIEAHAGNSLEAMQAGIAYLEGIFPG